jgi:hypothetical protein
MTSLTRGLCSALGGLLFAACAPNEPAVIVTRQRVLAPATMDSTRTTPADRAAADSAQRVLAEYLELSREGTTGEPGERTALLGCDMSTERFLPIEMLAAYTIEHAAWRGDTVVVRASVITVAEQDADRADPARIVARQRVRRGEWEWDIVRGDDGWLVCNGPQFGFAGGEMEWRLPGSSMTTARALADSVWRVSGHTAPGASR